MDAIGQKAGTLRAGTSPGNTGTLAVTSGWLEVTNNLLLGSGGGVGVVNHTGGAVTVLNGIVSTINGDYNLSGGTLTAPQIHQSATGSLNLTGGRLSAGLIVGNVLNQGATIAPGASPGQTQIQGDLTLQSGTLEIEIAGVGAGQFDRFVVAGVLAAGGVLDVNFLNGFTPEANDSFDLFDFASAAGAFTLDLPALAGGLSWKTSNLLTTGRLSVVPEPTSAALALLLTALAFARRRSGGAVSQPRPRAR